MNIRNHTYTLYNGMQLQLTRDSRDQFMLIHQGENAPDLNFEVSGSTQKILSKSISKEEITNAFNVQTFAKYKGHEFQVLSFENNKFWLITSNWKTAKELNLQNLERGSYQISVPKTDIEKMWEVRSKSGYGFPFPEGMKEVEEITFK